MDGAKPPASNLIQNTPYHHGIQSRNTNTKISNIQSKHLIHNNYNNVNNISSYRDSSLKIACHNLNGLKRNNQKLCTLLEWAEEDRINILGLAETNISSKEGHFLTPRDGNFVSFWANANQGKKKGSGVGLLINKQWQKYLGKIDRWNE